MNAVTNFKCPAKALTRVERKLDNKIFCIAYWKVEMVARGDKILGVKSGRLGQKLGNGGAMRCRG